MNRVSTRYQYTNSLNQIRSGQAKLFAAQQEVTTGKRGDIATKDPLGTAFIIRSSALKSATEQYDKNLRTADDYLKNSEAALDEVTKVLQSARSLAIQGASDAVDQTARNSMAAQVTNLQNRLLELSNTRGNSGQYLFAGQDNGTTPFSAVAGTMSYGGDTNQVRIEASRTETMVVNSSMGTTFTSMYSALENLKNDLLSGNIALLSGQDLTNLSQSMDAVRLERGVIGTKLQSVQELSTQNQRRIEDLTERIADVEEVDMAEAITQYKLAETAYQAALQSTAMSSRLSLLDFIQ